MLPVYAVGSVKLEELCRDVLKHAHPQIMRKTLIERLNGCPSGGSDP